MGSGIFSKFLALRSLTSKDDSVWVCVDLCRYRGQACGRRKWGEMGGREREGQKERGREREGRREARKQLGRNHFGNGLPGD